MKKYFIILLAAALLVLSACSGDITKEAPAEDLEITTSTAAETDIEAAESAAAMIFSSDTEQEEKNVKSYILNERSYKIHEPSCYSVEIMAEHNKNYVEADLQDLLEQGYSRCRNCYPD